MISKKEIVKETFFDILEKDMYVEIPVYGLSMFPFYLPGDTVRIKKATKENIKIGEVVIFNSSYKIIAHRLIKINNSFSVITTKGDGLKYFDKPIPFDKVKGVVVKHYRNGKVINRYKSNKFKLLITKITPLTGHIFFIAGRFWNKFFNKNKT